VSFITSLLNNQFLYTNVLYLPVKKFININKNNDINKYVSILFKDKCKFKRIGASKIKKSRISNWSNGLKLIGL
jgi:hypothetical protein